MRVRPLVVLLVALSGGCARQASQPVSPVQRILGDPGIQPPPDDAAIYDSLRRELPRREAQWAAHGITNYRLAVRLLCYCPAPPLGVVTVRGESVMVRNALGQPLNAGYTEALAFTVPKLFAELRRGLSDTSFIVSTRFHSTYGFPTQINLQDRATGHVGYLAVIEAFEVLAEASPSRTPRQN